MANTRPLETTPTLAQVRDYVLTMLEGLSSLAEAADDPHTRDRIRDFSDQLVLSWASRPEALLRQRWGRLGDEPGDRDEEGQGPDAEGRAARRKA